MKQSWNVINQCFAAMSHKSICFVRVARTVSCLYRSSGFHLQGNRCSLLFNTGEGLSRHLWDRPLEKVSAVGRSAGGSSLVWSSEVGRCGPFAVTGASQGQTELMKEAKEGGRQNQTPNLQAGAGDYVCVTAFATFICLVSEWVICSKQSRSLLDLHFGGKTVWECLLKCFWDFPAHQCLYVYCKNILWVSKYHFFMNWYEYVWAPGRFLSHIDFSDAQWLVWRSQSIIYS